jgi:hypothetical protein
MSPVTHLSHARMSRYTFGEYVSVMKFNGGHVCVCTSWNVFYHLIRINFQILYFSVNEESDLFVTVISEKV